MTFARASLLPLVIAGCLAVSACHEVSSFSTGASSRYVGPVIPADFVLSGISSTAQLCLQFDADHIQDLPGTITTSDHLFQSTPLRPIPQLWHDPLSTFTFGEGRIQNLLYIATPTSDAGMPADVTVVISLMDGGGVEVRLVRGAPPVAPPDASSTPPANNLFAVFSLTMQPGACPF
jgi:hypothetical protein